MKTDHNTQDYKTTSFVNTNNETLGKFKDEYKHNVELKKDATTSAKNKNDQTLKRFYV